MRDVLPRPTGRVRVHAVESILLCGRSVGKSTTMAAMGVHAYGKQLEHLQKHRRPVGWTPKTGWRHNDILYEWAAIVGNLLLRRGNQYGIGGMYIEYQNVASPGDPISPPVVTRDHSQGVDYYNSLSTDPTGDYLRVPLIAGIMNLSDTTKFPAGNVPTFFAQTSGTVGVHGKPFSDVHNSTVFGGALVSFVDAADATQDLVISRFYLSTGDQQPKLPTSQVGLEWQLILQ